MSQSATPKKSGKKSKATRKPKKQNPYKSEIKKLKKELEDQKNEMLYLRADFDNFKKQTLKERTQLIRYGGKPFIIHLINEVMDDFERAFKQNTNSEEFQKGMDLIFKKLKETFKKFGSHLFKSGGRSF